MTTATLDLDVFGHRLRHFRRQRKLTLDQLGELVAKPAPYLSQLENGHAEPKLSLLGDLAGALGVSLGELVDNAPPNRRADLEIRLAQAQANPAYAALRLPHLKPSAKVGDDILEHLLTLYEAWQGADAVGSGTDPVRAANLRLRREMRERDNYFESIERLAAEALNAIGYPGYGPVSERNVGDIVANYGFSIDRVQDLPVTSRSITDLRSRVIYIPQRNEISTRASRSIVLSTLGHFVLDHGDPVNVEDYLRQRVESNYFAAAVLAPQAPVVRHLREAKAEGQIAAEDIKDLFYVSYEMAAHRITNLATRHLDITLHFLRTDHEGVMWKAYENNGVPLPTHPDGTIEGMRVPATWGPRQAFMADDAFTLHPQYTDTVTGQFWCVTHVETDTTPYNAVTLGTTADQAKYFRGSDTTRRFVSPANDPQTAARERAMRRLAGQVWPSARDRHQVVATGLDGPGGFDPYPGVDMDEVIDFFGRRDDT